MIEEKYYITNNLITVETRGRTANWPYQSHQRMRICWWRGSGRRAAGQFEKAYVKEKFPPGLFLCYQFLCRALQHTLHLFKGPVSHASVEKSPEDHTLPLSTLLRPFPPSTPFPSSIQYQRLVASPGSSLGFWARRAPQNQLFSVPLDLIGVSGGGRVSLTVRSGSIYELQRRYGFVFLFFELRLWLSRYIQNRSMAVKLRVIVWRGILCWNVPKHT